MQAAAQRGSRAGDTAAFREEQPFRHPPQDELGSELQLPGTTQPVIFPAPPSHPFPKFIARRRPKKYPASSVSVEEQDSCQLRRVQPTGRYGYCPASCPDEGVGARAHTRRQAHTHTPAQRKLFRAGAPHPPRAPLTRRGPRGCVPGRVTEC